MEEIKKSKVIPTEKQVILWTPVVISKQFPQHVKFTKTNYRSGELLNNQDFPKSLDDLAGGLIINMPLIGIKQFLGLSMQLSNLMSDSDLIDFLE